MKRIIFLFGYFFSYLYDSQREDCNNGTSSAFQNIALIGSCAVIPSFVLSLLSCSVVVYLVLVQNCPIIKFARQQVSQLLNKHNLTFEGKIHVSIHLFKENRPKKITLKGILSKIFPTHDAGERPKLVNSTVCVASPEGQSGWNRPICNEMNLHSQPVLMGVENNFSEGILLRLITCVRVNTDSLGWVPAKHGNKERGGW